MIVQLPMRNRALQQVAVVSEDGATVTIGGPCYMTGKTHVVTVKADELVEWVAGRKHIQDAMPSASAEDREFLLSGCSPAGWDEIMKGCSDEPV
jgi:hypothetical protein